MHLKHNTIDVWLCDPRKFQDQHVTQQLHATLSPGERRRHHAFHFAKDRHTFLVAHGVLRHLASRYTGRQPHTCEFVASEHGRPELVQDDAEESLRFNLSHTRAMVAWIFSRSQPCGVDVEEVRYDSPISALVESTCSSEERRVLAALHGPERTRQFYRTWCLKEALLKGCGIGLTDHLDCITIRGIGDGCYCAEDRLHRVSRPGEWFLQVRMQGDSHVLAVAYEKGAELEPAVFLAHFEPEHFAPAKAPVKIGHPALAVPFHPQQMTPCFAGLGSLA